MREFLSMVSGERRFVGRYIMLSTLLVAFTFAAAQGMIALITHFVPDQTTRISANTMGGTTRTYTVTRSVLDDTITTGSVPRPGTAKIDPCRN